MSEMTPTARYGELLALLDDHDPAVSKAARDGLVVLTRDHMVRTAHRMLRSFRRVRQRCETDDVVQEAAIRLHRALVAVIPESPQALLGLAAVQVRRQLLDLAKRFGGPQSLMRHMDTNVYQRDGRAIEQTALAPAMDEGDMERWVAFHEAAAGLPQPDRQVFDMVWYLGASQEDVATLLGCSTRTVRRRWESIKKRFIDHFEAIACERRS